MEVAKRLGLLGVGTIWATDPDHLLENLRVESGGRRFGNDILNVVAEGLVLLLEVLDTLGDGVRVLGGVGIEVGEENLGFGLAGWRLGMGNLL